MTSALLVLDVQMALLQGEPPHDFDNTLVRIATLIARAKAANAPVIWVQHGAADGDFATGSPTWPFVPQVAPQLGDWVVHKASSDAFAHTTLPGLLQDLGVSGLVVCGYASEFCVDTTVRSAAARGLRVTLAADAHTTRNRAVLSAQQIKAHLHWLLPHLAVPGVPIAVMPAADIQFQAD